MIAYAAVSLAFGPGDQMTYIAVGAMLLRSRQRSSWELLTKVAEDKNSARRSDLQAQREAPCLVHTLAHALLHLAERDHRLYAVGIFTGQRRAHRAHDRKIDRDRHAVRLGQLHLAVAVQSLAAGDAGHIVHGFRGKRTAVVDVIFPVSRPIIVGREHRGIAVLPVQLAQIRGTGIDIVVRVVRIGAEAIWAARMSR